MATKLQSFPPIADRNARVLILGSMPGVQSLAAGQYYAHPRNGFWRVMGELIALDPNAPYAQRTRALKANGIALWDVLSACVRPGSLDADITDAEPNDFAAFLAKHRRIERIGFNGAAAHKIFDRLVEAPSHIDLVRLPSTSPAHAGMSFEKKCAAWKRLLAL